jgi:hypothetical protein
VDGCGKDEMSSRGRKEDRDECKGGSASSPFRSPHPLPIMREAAPLLAAADRERRAQP